MNLEISNQAFVVGGAGSGFGRAIVNGLANEGARVLAVSKTRSKLEHFAKLFPDQVDCLAVDLLSNDAHDQIVEWVIKNQASGMVFNAGGPPAGGFQHMSMTQWDEAYALVLRWKMALTQKVLPYFQRQGYGRLVYVESVSVKQPVKNLVLSNSLRAAVVGAVKTIAQEVAGLGITANLLAPGYHRTSAMERLFVKKSELESMSIEQAALEFEKEIPVGSMGKPEELASMALWLLSPLSRYVTGQTITHDGGMVDGIFG